MAGWIEKQLSNIADFATEMADKIYQKEESGFQSPLELNGLAMRQMMKNTAYYKKEYPYAICGDSGFLRTIDKYVSASGWRPATFDINNTVVNAEFENISKEFDVQK